LVRDRDSDPAGNTTVIIQSSPLDTHFAAGTPGSFEALSSNNPQTVFLNEGFATPKIERGKLQTLKTTNPLTAEPAFCCGTNVNGSPAPVPECDKRLKAEVRSVRCESRKSFADPCFTVHFWLSLRVDLRPDDHGILPSALRSDKTVPSRIYRVFIDRPARLTIALVNHTRDMAGCVLVWTQSERRSSIQGIAPLVSAAQRLVMPPGERPLLASSSQRAL
jgi:hypothetical protein